MAEREGGLSLVLTTLLEGRLKAEIARNPFLRREDDRKEKDAPPPDPGAPG